MAQDPVLFALFSIIDLLKGSFIISIPVFIFVFIAVFVRKALAKKYGWNWFKSSLITTYFLVFSMIFVLYLAPIMEVLLSAQKAVDLFFLFLTIIAATVAIVFLFVVISLVFFKKNFLQNFSKLGSLFLYGFILALILYAPQLLTILSAPTSGIILPELQPTFFELITPVIVQFVRLLIVALLLTFLLMPLEFVGLFLFEKISEKLKIAYSLRLFLTIFIASVFTWTIILLLAPWVISGTIYLIFFGFE